MLAELFRALFAAGIPVAITSYLLAWWAMKNNYFGSVSSVKGLEQEVKRFSKAKSKDRKNKKKTDWDGESETLLEMGPVHKKWLSFGGGFYGVVALLTYIVVELGEVRDFISDLGGFFQMLSNISINLLVNFIIESLANFLSAIAWPWYWMTEISSSHIWTWFVAAYAGYWAGTRFALHQAAQRKAGL